MYVALVLIADMESERNVNNLYSTTQHTPPPQKSLNSSLIKFTNQKEHSILSTVCTYTNFRTALFHRDCQTTNFVILRRWILTLGLMVGSIFGEH